MFGTVKTAFRGIVGHSRVRRMKARRLAMAEAVGVHRWSRPGLGGLDVRLAEQIGSPMTRTFIEFGANDGLQQSNTYMLEREFEWRGVLVEAIPELAAECARNRPRALVICAAVTNPGRSGQPIGFDDQDLTSSLGEGRVMTCSTTLSLIIESALNDETPDLIIVDIEGHELEALAGLDLQRHAPMWLLVETDHPSEVTKVLGGRYGAPIPLSHHDYLYTRR